VRERRTARDVAVDALLRIDAGAYANLVVPSLLDASGLSERDRRLVTGLVYGTTRMRRACDWLADRFVIRPLDTEVRAALRLGVYQVTFLSIPDHAAVTTAVGAAPRRARGLVNAVLRRVVAAGRPGPGDWPDEATRLSYPDWIVDAFDAELGPAVGRAALEEMNRPAEARVRSDGYVQDEASQWVAELVGCGPGQLVADLCAAPGGKATWMAAAHPALVVAGDARASRARLLVDNAVRLGATNLSVLVGDGTRPPLRPGVFDRVLVDAPCSGLGVLRRRPDARWRVRPDDVRDLAHLQRRLLLAAADLVRPGGTLTYSVCTLTRAETSDVADWHGMSRPDLAPLAAPGPPWEPVGAGARLLPQSAGTDGMFVAAWRHQPDTSAAGAAAAVGDAATARDATTAGVTATVGAAMPSVSLGP
jgi:16S rRNA (cytosine967-C5)-methyltransferase